MKSVTQTERRRTAKGGNGGRCNLPARQRWQVVLRRDAGGRPRKVLYGRTRQEVAQKLSAAQNDLRQGLPLPSERDTLGAYLARWLEDSARPTVKPSTYRSYEQLVRVHIIPALGTQPLARLGAAQVQRFLNEKRASGLSARTSPTCTRCCASR